MLKPILIGLCGLTLLISQALLADSRGAAFYRYTNSEGVKVMNHTLPAEYAQSGYEVVSLSGKVIEVVPPAPSAEEAARMEQEHSTKAELEEWDTRLRRRFSSVDDIEAAKQRKLAGITTNINILTGNISKLTTQLQLQQGQAAASERKGHKVPEKLLTNITNLELEIKTSEDLVAVRNEEYKMISDKYDRDIERFKVINPARK